MATTHIALDDSKRVIVAGNPFRGNTAGAARKPERAASHPTPIRAASPGGPSARLLRGRVSSYDLCRQLTALG